MKMLLDLAVGAHALEKIYDDMYTLFNNIAYGNPDWHGDISKNLVKKVASKIEADSITSLATQLFFMQN